MEDISNRLAVALAIIVVLTSTITTLAFFNLQQNYSVQETKVAEGGKVSIHISGPNNPGADQIESGQVAIRIAEER